MSASPGFWACLVRSWIFLTQLDMPNERSLLLDGLSRFLADCDVRSHPERLKEMVDAAGSIGSFAKLVEDFIGTVAEHSRSPLDHIQRLLIFIGAADELPEDRGHGWVSAPLSLALFTYSNCAAELLVAVLVFCHREEPQAGPVMDEWLMLVRRMIKASPAKLWLDELRDRGLLGVGLDYTTLRGAWVEAQAPYALKEGQNVLLGDEFKQTVLYDPWKKFLAAAEECLEALAKYESPLFEARKTCDNEEESSPVKRCSGCQAINAPGTANEMTGKSGTGTLVAPTTAYFSDQNIE
ncbi:hypothetical protein FB45DRAFT_1121514 [Roridomyces roridus]|uniref:Uncharacterized protein n=1 Tax=Roridomyces roridus TaxID=1738132 RepID=A0AAD7B4I8_9AGAR|nr:hypothetical protein FB45DRAFT_1121514 [Roridomyces roridus]